jgi:acetoin utilization deacetylase AcuC-like enzyme
MRLTTGAFAAMTMALRLVAEECCGGRVALVTEGGYDLQALAASLESVVDVLAAAPGPPLWPGGAGHVDRGRASAQAAKRALESFWNVE